MHEERPLATCGFKGTLGGSRLILAPRREGTCCEPIAPRLVGRQVKAVTCHVTALQGAETTPVWVVLE